jgi:tripartite-type tricarboxylate transporter receptor subunit TctC
MFPGRRHVFKFVCAVLGALAIAGSAFGQQQTWPTKPVRIIVAVAAGALPDRIGRLFADGLGRQLGEPVIVENITGVGGQMAAIAAVKAPPDGYTLLFAGAGAMVFDKYLLKNPGYDSARDLIPIAMIYEQDRLAIAVHPDVPAKTLPELIALAKSRPGKLTYGVTNSSLPTMVGRWIGKLADIDVLGVTYKTQGQQMQDVIAGRIDWIISTPQQVESFVRAGKLRIVALDGVGRYAAMPEIGTIAEVFPGYRASGFGVLAGPRGIPPAVVQTLNAAADKVVRDPAYIQQLAAMAASANGAGSPEYIANFVRDRRQYWDGIFKALNVQPE